MLTRLIQSIFFLCICTSLQAMHKNQKDIVHAKLYEKYQITETPQNYRPVIQPLDDLLNRSKIRANHIKDLHDMNQHQRALDSYERTKHHTPEDLSILKPETQKAYRSIQKFYRSSKNIIEKSNRINAFMGDKNSQILIAEQYINKLSNITDAPELLETIKSQHCLEAYEFLDFTTTLNDRNISCPLTDYHDRQLVALRNKIDTINPSAAYIIQSIRCLQPFTEYKKKLCYNNLSTMIPETAETEIICQFFINYGDNTLSPQDATKKFIAAVNNCGNNTTQITKTISNCKNDTLSPQDIAEQLKRSVRNQKKSADIIAAIAETPLISKVLQKLSSVTLDSNDPFAPDFNYILAELHSNNENYTQADKFYKKNTVTFLKEKKVQYHAFKASIATSQSFTKQDISYLSSLVGNVYNQLKKMDTTNPELSYNVGLLIHALVNNNPVMGISEKINMLNDALHHLECTQEAITTCLELHAELATLYTQENDHVSALKHTKYALQYHNSSTQEYAIAAILNHAEQNSADLYKQHAQLIHYIVNFIITENHTSDIKKNYSLPSEFISSDLWQKLLPYCDQAYANNKNANNDITYAMALSHADNGNYDKASTYIDALPQPLSNTAQLLKARIYVATQKTMSDEELEATFKAFVQNKKTSSTDQETVVSLLMQSDRPERLLTQPQHHDLAIKAIAKLSDKYTSNAAIQLAFHITKNLQIINSPSIKQWQEKLKSCDQFYANIAAPSEYNGYTNFAAGLLLMSHGIQHAYAQVISYFMTALHSKELLPETAQSAQKLIATLYNSWAMTTNDPNTQLVLFNKALEYNNNSTTRFNYAIAILEHSDDQSLINKALQLLEENSAQDSPIRTVSQCALAQAYCHYNTNPARMTLFKKLIPLDINKAIGILQDHNNQPELLKPLISILAGESIWTPIQLAEQYANIEQALHYMDIVLDTDKNNIDYISLRMELHFKLNNIDAAIADIDLMLKAQDLSNTRGVTKEKLLFNKANFLLSKTPNDALYDQILECFQQLKTYNESDIIRFNTYPLVQEHTKHLIDHNITTDSAIEWCCFAANSCVAANNCRINGATLLSADLLSKQPSQEEKDLAHYILSAAKKGNLDAQLISLPYLNTIGYVTESNLTESLRYSHQALLNPNSAKKRANVIFLVELLQIYVVQQGVMLAYYIICDYYKNYPKEIEKKMLLFNQAKKHERPGDDATDLIDTIFKSCKNAFSKSAERCVKNKKNLHKLTLTDGIALFTLGSMYQYSNREEVLKSAISYLEIAHLTLCEKLKLKQYQVSIQFLTGSAYYKLALINEKINYELLRKSAQTGYLAALHKMAEIYIEQHKSGKQDIPIKTTDFMPLLAKDLNFPPSRELFEKCADIATSQKEADDHDKPVLVTLKANATNLTEFLKEKATYITKDQITENVKIKVNLMESPHVAKLVKYPKDKQTSEPYLAALQCIRNGKDKDAIPFLFQAMQEKHPSACMLLALTYIAGTISTKDYNIAEKSLHLALLYGLVNNDTTKQFDTISLLTRLMDCVKCLIREEHPAKTKRHLLSTINNTLTENGINMYAFYELFNEVHNIDLSTVPEWSAISSARKTIVKDISNTKIPSTISKAMAASDRGDKATAANHMHFAAITEKVPSACMLLSWDYLFGNGVKQDNDASEKYLHDAFTYGLVEHQFCTDNFLYTVYACIQQLASLSTSSSTKKYFLQIIKEELIAHGINMTAFYTVVKENTGIDLLSIPEWIGTDTNNKPSITDLKNKLVKDLTNNSISDDFKKALNAFLQKDVTQSVIFMELAAQNNDPCAEITIASNYLLGREGTRKSLALATCHVKQALQHSLIEQQFCNSLFLHKLCKFIQNVICMPYTSDEIVFKKRLLREIKQKLIQENINLTDFCDIVANDVNVHLHTYPDWIDAENVAQFTKEECASSINESLNESETEMAKRKKQSTMQPVNQENSLIRDQDYKEDPAFTQAIAKASPDGIKRGMELIKEAAEKRKHPQACLILSSNYLRGENTLKKNIQLSEKQLKNALEYGVSEKQFCNNPFLLALCCYIFVMITDQPKSIAQKILPIIKKALEAKAVDLKLFEAAFEKEHTINLSTVSGWSGTNTNSTHTNAPVEPQPSITDIRKKMVKDHANSNLSDDFKQALADTFKKDMTKMTSAANKNDACACITMALHNVTGEGVRKCLYLSGAYVKEALNYGLIEQQFCNNLFLKKLCSYIKTVISTEYAPDDILFKKQLLHKIKKNLLMHKIDLTDFCTIVLSETEINLLTCPEWIHADKDYKFTNKKKLLLRVDALKSDNVIDNCFQVAVTNIIQNINAKHENQHKNKLIQHPRPQDSLGFTAVEDAAVKGDIKKCMKLAKTVAEIEHHPRAYILLAFEHIRGTFLNKDIDASKHFLICALFYGLVEQYFYNDEFLKDVCDYINFVIKAKYSKNNKQTLLSIIKKALEKQSIDLNAFNDAFKKEHNKDLSIVAEWNS